MTAPMLLCWCCVGLMWLGAYVFEQGHEGALILTGAGGAVGLFGAALWAWRGRAARASRRSAWALGLVGYLAACASALGLAHAEHVWALGLGAALWVVASSVLISQWRLLSDHPVVLSRARWVHQTSAMVQGALLVVSAGALIGASRSCNRVQDVTYARTAWASATTLKVAQGLTKGGATLNVHVFMPAHTPQREQVLAYFEPFKAIGVEVNALDQAQDPALARELNVRDNGEVVITLQNPTVGDASPAWSRRVFVGTQVASSRRRLRRMDRLVSAQLRDLSDGERVVYVLAGHGELSWQTTVPTRRLALFHRIGEEVLTSTMRTIDSPALLSQGVPQDADALVWMAPERGVAPEIVDAVEAYVRGGGALWLALEPGQSEARASLAPLLGRLGVLVDVAPVAATQGIVALTQSRADRYTLLIEDLSAHPITAGIREARRMNVLISHATRVQAERGVLARTRPQAWVDTLENAAWDRDEPKGPHGIVWASDVGKGRVFLSSDATMWTDALMQRSPGNQQLMQDAMHWLYRREDLSGVTTQERDVRITHSRASQRGWIGLMVAGLPLLLLGAGVLRTRRSQETP